MRYPTLLLPLLALTIAGARAQHIRLDHPLADPRARASLGAPSRAAAFPETLRVLTCRVEFQTDTDDRTSGNGRFDLTSSKRVPDPPPHDASYALAHLAFLENYYRKVSDGKLIIQCDLLPGVYELPRQMKYYSPSRTSANNIELGRLLEDSWRAVDSVNRVEHAADSTVVPVPFSRYGCFIVLHAGVGRDIDMASLYGYDPTPYDIPSIYLNLPALKNMFGSSYAGIAVGAGGFRITNSIILPETESREISSIGGTALLSLGVNGLLAASVGSHLGLPDLFDTQTGATGIGRFGLMDGQSIFSWEGFFPPEPSAWEKCYLGWVEPVMVTSPDTVVSLPAVSRSTPDTIYRVPVSAKEYFLLENRCRDANLDSARVTLLVGADTLRKVWGRDTSGFYAYSQDSLYGVVLDVDEFDWSLPGGVDSRTKEFYNGGILIWHIDENVIEAGIASDRVNANPGRRGVNLEEADGSQDIGQTYAQFTAPSGSEDGSPLDFWYGGNPAPLRLRSNAFTPDSYPASTSNDGANSHVTIRSFSPRGPLMTARILVGDDRMKPMAGFPQKLGSSPGRSGVVSADLDGDGAVELLVSTTGRSRYTDTAALSDARILAWRQDGRAYFPTTDSLANFVRVPGRSFGPAAAIDFRHDGSLAIASFSRASNDRTVGVPVVFSSVDANHDGVADSLWQSGIGIGGDVYDFVSVCATDSFVAWAGPVLLAAGIPGHTLWGGGGAHFIEGLAALGGTNSFVALGRDSTVERLSHAGRIWERRLPEGLSGSPAVGDLAGDGSLGIVVLGRSGRVYRLRSDGSLVTNFHADAGEPAASSPAIGDIDGDGRKEIVVAAGTRIYAFNAAGSLVDHFPIQVPTTQTILSSPVIGDLNGDGVMDIVITTQEGLVAAYDAHGSVVPGFPLQSGATYASPTLFRTVSGHLGLALASEDHYLYAWELSTAYDSTKLPWPMYLHDARMSGFESLPGSGRPAAAFFPSSRAYNWPNPVGRDHGYRTHIRYYVGEDARVNIRIFDMAGDLVASFGAPGSGGLDNEVEWDVSGIQSGIYFARVEARGTSQTAAAVIKIAVIK